MAELIAEWPAIAGAGLATHAIPIKLSKATGSAATSQLANPATLHLKVDPTHALEVQYSVPQLIERLNRTLGYQAVSGVRIIQGPLQPKKSTATPRQTLPNTPRSGESRLSGALARMAAGIQARR